MLRLRLGTVLGLGLGIVLGLGLGAGLSLVIFLTEHSGLSLHNFEEPGKKTEPGKTARVTISLRMGGYTIVHTLPTPCLFTHRDNHQFSIKNQK